jgi:hypothetical protein
VSEACECCESSSEKAGFSEIPLECSATNYCFRSYLIICVLSLFDEVSIDSIDFFDFFFRLFFRVFSLLVSM